MLTKFLDLIFAAIANKTVPESSSPKSLDAEETVIVHPKLLKLYPRAAVKFQRFVDAAKVEMQKKGYDVDIHMSIRTWEEQDGLYAIGRTKELDRKPVTKAKGGQSYHNYGLAIDMVFDGDTNKKGMQWSWDDKYPWSTLGNIGKSFGLEWAGDWKTFREMPHFQMAYGTTIAQLQGWYKTGGLEKVWAELDKVGD